MYTRILTLIAMIAALSIYAGCSNGNINMRGEESLLEQNWGRAFESAKYNQMLNPDAENKEASVEVLDGQAAQQTVEQYRKAFGGKTGGSTTGYSASNVNTGAMTPGTTPGKQAQ